MKQDIFHYLPYHLLSEVGHVTLTEGDLCPPEDQINLQMNYNTLSHLDKYSANLQTSRSLNHSSNAGCPSQSALFSSTC